MTGWHGQTSPEERATGLVSDQAGGVSQGWGQSNGGWPLK